MSKVLGIGIAGLGTVGTGFLKQLKGLKTTAKKSANIRVVKIAVKSLKKKRDLPIKQLPLTSNTLSLADDNSIDVVVELIGGSKGIAYNLVIGLKKGYKENKICIVSALDNLLKGAAGQAIQNFNVMNDFGEDEGILMWKKLIC